MLSMKQPEVGQAITFDDGLQLIGIDLRTEDEIGDTFAQLLAGNKVIDKLAPHI